MGEGHTCDAQHEGSVGMPATKTKKSSKIVAFKKEALAMQEGAGLSFKADRPEVEAIGTQPRGHMLHSGHRKVAAHGGGGLASLDSTTEKMAQPHRLGHMSHGGGEGDRGG